ncbi:MAG: restriction endonuclease subunit S [Lachnospiraceae bacterium]|nr:restriction endonuclease subunit S [Lachnospiraceae bacterium]
MKCNLYTLGDLVSIKYGKNQKRVQSDKGEVPIYGTGGLMGYATEALYDKPSVLIGRKGTINKVRYVDHPFWTVDTLFYTIINEELVIPKYLYYRMSLLNLDAYNEGTTIPSLRTETLNRLEFVIPSIDDQRKVLAVLEPIYTRIKLNEEINDNLSQQIQLIYDNLADGLTGDPVNLSSIIDVRDGTHDSPKAVDEGFPLVTSKHLLPYGVDLSNANLISKEDFDKTNERSIVETHDILISMIGTVGLISLVIDNPVPFAIKNVGLFKTSKCPELYAYILTYLRSTKTTHHIEKTLAGSTQKYISLGELRKMPIILPDENQLNDFNSIVVPLIMQITNLTEENKRLAELRDTLLPKLMSGELDISDIDI